jgi:hypothetical protein
MAKFKIMLNTVMEFENDYQVFFEPGGVAPYSIMAHVWTNGRRVALEQFGPNKMNGYFTCEEFAKLLYKVSLATKVIEEEVLSDDHPVHSN